MGLEDWDWHYPTELQDVPWDCAAASLSWCLQAAGLPYSESDVVKGLGPTRISPALGLLDASGQGIVDWLGEIGVLAENTPLASWDDIVAAAGYQPMLMGGRRWYHWVGVRISTAALDGDAEPAIAIANPAPGYQGIRQTLTPDEFDMLGPFSAVWFTQW